MSYGKLIEKAREVGNWIRGQNLDGCYKLRLILSEGSRGFHRTPTKIDITHILCYKEEHKLCCIYALEI